VKSLAPVKMLTIRGTAFEPSPATGGSAVVQKGFPFFLFFYLIKGKTFFSEF
jgi:hypothetical protein